MALYIRNATFWTCFNVTSSKMDRRLFLGRHGNGIYIRGDFGNSTNTRLMLNSLSDAFRPPSPCDVASETSRVVWLIENKHDWLKVRNLCSVESMARQMPQWCIRLVCTLWSQGKCIFGTHRLVSWVEDKQYKRKILRYLTPPPPDACLTLLQILRQIAPKRL